MSTQFLLRNNMLTKKHLPLLSPPRETREKTNLVRQLLLTLVAGVGRRQRPDPPPSGRTTYMYEEPGRGEESEYINSRFAVVADGTRTFLSRLVYVAYSLCVYVVCDAIKPDALAVCCFSLLLRRLSPAARDDHILSLLRLGATQMRPSTGRKGTKQRGTPGQVRHRSIFACSFNPALRLCHLVLSPAVTSTFTFLFYLTMLIDCATPVCAMHQTKYPRTRPPDTSGSCRLRWSLHRPAEFPKIYRASNLQHTS